VKSIFMANWSIHGKWTDEVDWEMKTDEEGRS